MFAATDKGIWRSDDGGQTWTEKTQGLPWKEIQGFAGGSDAAAELVMLYCSVRSKDENGAFKGGIYRSRDRGETWESAMGRGLNTETKTGRRVGLRPHLAIPPTARRPTRKPLTVYAFNTSTGFHPPHSDTVYRSDDGGADLARYLLPGSPIQGLQRRARIGKRPRAANASRAARRPSAWPSATATPTA